jgi:cytoskeleton protein RodZ
VELPAGTGARLRREREYRGLSEQQAAEQLNLDVNVIVALEADDYAALGAPVFAKGHLRRYGASLGLPEDELLAAFEAARAELPQPSLIPKSREEMMPVRARPKWPWLAGSALLFLLAAGLVAYISEIGIGWPGRAGVPTERSPIESAPTESSATSPQPAIVPTPAAATPGSDAQAPQSPAAAQGGQVSLQLRFVADSWVEIYDGSGKAVLYDLGRAGTQRAVTAAGPLSITLGNAPAVALQVNGRAVTVPAPPAGQTVARFGIGPDGSLH